MSKRLALTLLALLAVTRAAGAQEATAGTAEPSTEAVAAASPRPAWEQIRFGLKAGATWSTLRGELAFQDVGKVGFKGDFGFIAGASVEFPVAEHLSLQPEAYLIRKFSELSLGVDKNILRQKLSVNYLEVPLLLKWYPGDRAGVQGNLVFGPMMSLRMDANIETRLLGNIVDADASDRIAGTDWGLLVGGGFEFAESFAALTVDLRYAHGIRNIDSVGAGDEARWSVLQALVGITF